MNYFRLFCNVVVTALSLTIMTGCASLIRPNFTQDIQQLKQGSYSLDPDHAFLIFRVEHLGLSTVVGRFNAVDASLDFDPDNINELSLEGLVDVASIDLNNEELEDRLKGSSWLDAAQYPQAIFRSVSVTPQGDNTFTIAGEFTLRGVTEDIELSATFKGGADNLLTGKYTLGFTASGSISRSAFGIDSFGALVADEIFIELHAEFQE